MMKGRNSGKKQLAIRAVKQALEIIHLVTGENPLQILVDALAAGGAREDSTRIGSGGVVRRQAVDVSPLRRVNQSIYLMTRGSREASFRSLKTLSECLADEIIAASKVHFEPLIIIFYRDLAVVLTVTPSERRTRLKELPRVTDDLILSP